MEVDYDRHADVLYISTGPPRPGYGETDTENPNIVITRDLETEELIGAIVIMFSRFPLEEILARLPFPVDPTLLR